MLWSIYCFHITRSQSTDEKGIQEEMGNNSGQSVLEQKVKPRNTLCNCNRIGLETEQGSAQPSPAPQGTEFSLQWTLTVSMTNSTHWNPSGKMSYYYLPSIQNFKYISRSLGFYFFFFFKATPLFSNKTLQIKAELTSWHLRTLWDNPLPGPTACDLQSDQETLFEKTH